ncbi:hypothetical protein B0A49_12149 [Cryomyces minteri]|uniref:Uncharacterized protein n=1 Tax=Cryomyces minteri TaxID=331657 RepID=A0A4U0VLK9_9PEZI|nr:hypothetical protein B0A49_12149 [Cryomyces minteri]
MVNVYRCIRPLQKSSTGPNHLLADAAVGPTFVGALTREYGRKGIDREEKAAMLAVGCTPSSPRLESAEASESVALTTEQSLFLEQ